MVQKKSPLVSQVIEGAMQAPAPRESLLDKTMATSMKLPDIMRAIEARDAARNKGLFGLDRRMVDEITKGIMRSSGKFEDAFPQVVEGMDRAEKRQREDVLRDLEGSKLFAEDELKQQRLDEERAHDLKKSALAIEAARDAAEQAQQYAKELAFYKNSLERKEPRLSGEGLYYKKDLDPAALKFHYDNMQEVNKGAGAAVDLIPKYEILKEIDEELYKAGVTGALDQINPIVRFDPKVRELLDTRESYVNGLVREIESTMKGTIKDSQIHMAVKEMPDPFSPLEAKKKIIDKWINTYQELIDKASYYNKEDQEGKVATGYSYAVQQQKKQEKEKKDKLKEEYKALLEAQG